MKCADAWLVCLPGLLYCFGHLRKCYHDQFFRKQYGQASIHFLNCAEGEADCCIGNPYAAYRYP